LIGSAIFRFGSKRLTARRDLRGDRRAIWDLARPSAMAYPSSGAPIPTADNPRKKTTRAADDPNRRITEMLAQLSRTAVT
jgi:hypothetical protein